MSLRLRQRTFPLFQRLGFHIVPNRFNQPIPDTRTLKPSLWERPSQLVGVKMNATAQLRLLSELAGRYKSEWDSFPLERTTPNRYYVNNRIFESVDGEMLYAMIRRDKPRRIVEVGSGFSTLLSAQAIARNTRDDPHYRCELIAIEPYPSASLRSDTGLTRLIDTEVQEVPLSLFTSLEPNDILFIDSSHVLRIGGDVQYECLEILPRLARGVLVHFHDIFFPSEYPPDTIFKGYQFYSEQYIVQAFLSFNDAFEILWGGSFMHLTHPDLLEAAFASYSRQVRWPGSLWLRRAG
ncbi:MAG TPA: class I SAM-dependent methyltransferase [Candidatus Dormibacteraeota bacterium]|nr:class I SAM-dependent methyltransferase [Candidatus Dormibacteraeota bacterium]